MRVDDVLPMEALVDLLVESAGRKLRQQLVDGLSWRPVVSLGCDRARAERWIRQKRNSACCAAALPRGRERSGHERAIGGCSFA
jgi:hypothetical protein